MVAEKGGRAFAPGELLDCGIRGEPLALAENGEDIGGGERIHAGGMFGNVIVGRHGASLARLGVLDAWLKTTALRGSGKASLVRSILEDSKCKGGTRARASQAG